MTALPFICLGIGIFLGSIIKDERFSLYSDKVSSAALIVLMLAIGMEIGMDNTIIKEFPSIGVHCLIISICAVGCSVLCTAICEKTILPLRQLECTYEYAEKDTAHMAENEGVSHLVWIMPVSLIFGVIAGILLTHYLTEEIINGLFSISLFLLYICVGISQGASKGIWSYLKRLGMKVLLLPVMVLIGSIAGGMIAGVITGVPMEVAVVSAGGMSFYSITGAYMTRTYGLAVGTYGFVVNVLREVITILALPLLIKISPGSAIAGGASGDMDTMLAPITKFVGPELGLVTLLTGTILTFIVPFLLPILTQILG